MAAVAPVYPRNLALWHLCSLFGLESSTNWMIAQYNIHAPKIGIPNLNLNLGRSISFAYDIVYGRGASIPAESELDRLGLNLADIKAHLAMHNTRKTVEQKKETRKQQLRMANRCLRDWWVADTDVEVMEDCGSVDADRDDSDDSA